MIGYSPYNSDFREVSEFEGFVTVFPKKCPLQGEDFQIILIVCFIFLTLYIQVGYSQLIAHGRAQTRAHKVTFKTCSVQPSTFCHAPLISLSLAPRLCVSSAAGRMI